MLEIVGGKRVLQKMVAYITREEAGKRRLLVFTHRDFPEAGIQVPAGTVEDGESIETALLREVQEETGLTVLETVRKLGVFNYLHPETGNLHVRHVYHLIAQQDAPDEWQWTETSGGQAPKEECYVFQFYWADLDAGVDLAGGQGDYLRYI